MTTSARAGRPTAPVCGDEVLTGEVLARRERQVGEIVERLSSRFPDVPASELERRIRLTYRQFSTSRVQDYLAILVERLVRSDLSATPPPPPP